MVSWSRDRDANQAMLCERTMTVTALGSQRGNFLSLETFSGGTLRTAPPPTQRSKLHCLITSSGVSRDSWLLHNVDNVVECLEDVAYFPRYLRCQYRGSVHEVGHS